jgi:sugar O-acyltransferase (sialic acid O-acetyltransferase NeuD family)
MKIVIIGCGGHGREMAQLVTRMRRAGADVEAIGFLDDNPDFRGRSFSELPVLGDSEWIERRRTEVQVVCAIGKPRIRRTAVANLARLGAKFATLIDPAVSIPPDAVIGEGAMICAGTIMTTNIRIGRHVIVNLGCTLSHDATLADFATLAGGVHLSGNVTLHEGAELGVGVNVIPGITIGEWAMVGAGAAVIRDLPPSVVAVGVPARVIKPAP